MSFPRTRESVLHLNPDLPASFLFQGTLRSLLSTSLESQAGLEEGNLIVLRPGPCYAGGMTAADLSAFWRQSADEAWKTVEALFEKERYVHALYFCHLTLEKLLKARYVERNGKPAPPTHDLVWLLDRSALALTDEERDALAEIAKFNIAGRYEDYKFELHRHAAAGLCENLGKQDRGAPREADGRRDTVMRKLDPDIRDTVRAFVRLIEAEGIPVKEARVFGSRARGTAMPESDIDVCVVSPAFGKDRLEETGMLLRLAARHRRSYPLEPVAFAPEDLDDPWSALAAEIRRDGIPVR